MYSIIERETGIVIDHHLTWEESQLYIGDATLKRVEE